MHVAHILIKNNLLLSTSNRKLTTFFINYCTKNLLTKRHSWGLQWDIVGGLGLILTLINRGCMKFQGARTGAEESGGRGGAVMGLNN